MIDRRVKRYLIGCSKLLLLSRTVRETSFSIIFDMTGGATLFVVANLLENRSIKKQTPSDPSKCVKAYTSVEKSLLH